MDNNDHINKTKQKQFIVEMDNNDHINKNQNSAIQWQQD